MAGKIEGRYTEEEYEKILDDYQRKTDEELLDIIRNRAKELGRPPKRTEIPASHYFKHRFGPWPRVLEQAGVKGVSEVHQRRVKSRAVRRDKRKIMRKEKGTSGNEKEKTEF